MFFWGVFFYTVSGVFFHYICKLLCLLQNYNVYLCISVNTGTKAQGVLQLYSLRRCYIRLLEADNTVAVCDSVRLCGILSTYIATSFPERKETKPAKETTPYGR